MPRNDVYGRYSEGRPAMRKVCNGGDPFPLCWLTLTEGAARARGVPVRLCAVRCAPAVGGRSCFLVLARHLFLNVRASDVVAEEEVAEAPVSTLLYERPPRKATTAMMGRHYRDLHVIPSLAEEEDDEGRGAAGGRVVCFRVTALPVDVVTDALAPLREAAVVIDLSSDADAPRGVAAHRELPAPRSSLLCEIRCADSAAYWRARDALAASPEVRGVAAKLPPGDLRWLPAEGTEAYEVILNPLNRGTEEWNARGYNEATPQERTDAAHFGPSAKETPKWMGILPPAEGEEGEKEEAATRVFCWEQLGAAVASRIKSGREAGLLSTVALQEPLASYVAEQATASRKRFYRSEAHLEPEQDRQLNDAAYRLFVRHHGGRGPCAPPRPAGVVALPPELQAAWLVCLVYLLHGFQPRRQRRYNPTGRLSGATGRPRGNWSKASNRHIYSDAAMKEANQARLRRSLDGAFVRHAPLVSRTKYPERHNGAAVYRRFTPRREAGPSQ